MNFFILTITALVFLGCSTPSKNIDRQPQSSVYEDTVVLSDDIDVVDRYEIDETYSDREESSGFDSICHDSKTETLKDNDRVVTMENGQYISGNITGIQVSKSDSSFTVSTDYGPNTVSLRKLNLKRSFDQISKALECVGTKSKKVYGLFKIENKFYTGHIREVYKNGVVRFVDDRFKEHFTTIDQSYLQKNGIDLISKFALFTYQKQQFKGQIRRVFEKDMVVIKFKGGLFLRKTSEIFLLND